MSPATTQIQDYFCVPAYEKWNHKILRRAENNAECKCDLYRLNHTTKIAIMQMRNKNDDEDCHWLIMTAPQLRRLYVGEQSGCTDSTTIRSTHWPAPTGKELKRRWLQRRRQMFPQLSSKCTLWWHLRGNFVCFRHHSTLNNPPPFPPTPICSLSFSCLTNNRMSLTKSVISSPYWCFKYNLEKDNWRSSGCPGFGQKDNVVL